MLNLPSLNDRQRERYATPKHLVEKTPLVKEEKRKAKKLSHKQFRDQVWVRDEQRCRATGKPLVRSHTDPHKVGEVHHVIPRSLAPERIFDVANGLLLSRYQHALAETACPSDPAHMLLDISGPDDRGEKQSFTWRDKAGTITKQRTG